MIDHFALWYDLPISAIDFETTGTQPTRGDKIVEIAVVRIERMKAVSRWHTFVNPERPIPDEVSRVHCIYDEDVALAPRFRDIAAKFLAVCDGTVPCAYNENFDRGFAMAELWDIGVPMSTPLLNWPSWLNPLTLVRSVDRFVVGPDGEKVSNSLSAACERRGIVVDGAHGAMADAEALAALLISLHGDLPRVTISELIRRQPYLVEAYEKRWNAAKAAGRVT